MKSETKISQIFDKLADHSAIFYIIMLIILIGVTVNFFNNDIMNSYVIEILILLNTIPLSSFVYMKITGRSIKPKPSLICPDCTGKMETKGSWKCNDCDGTFQQGKKQSIK